MPDYNYTEKQGQYLAFIYNYAVIHGRPPAETDMQRFFGVRAPTVHQMVLRLDERELITREPGKPRTIQVLVPPDQLPYLKERSSHKSHNKRKTMPSKANIYQIKVTLEGSKPPIWRRLLVRSDITLKKLHHILQVAMGWTNSHLHQFIVGGTYIGEPHPDYDDYLDMHDERDVTLRQIVSGEKFKFRYEYDFGDSWLHQVLVEKVLPPEPGQQYPLCVKGKRACPPEDVGGIWTYNYFVESIQNPDHPDYPGNDDYLEWVGDEFDAEEFDLDEVNEVLHGLR